ncbi:hypothetical protein X801_06513, partial [Opisthorchis viverrini]|uniref:Uncharacterized protein n=2 Tax=Opisthorchis viverrini TaxID=6198 RepID=A0A074Z4W3_OPIVI
MLSAWLCSVAGLLLICHACVTFRMNEGDSVYAMTDDPMDKCIAACYVCFLQMEEAMLNCVNSICQASESMKFPEKPEQLCASLRALSR